MYPIEYLLYLSNKHVLILSQQLFLFLIMFVFFSNHPLRGGDRSLGHCRTITSEKTLTSTEDVFFVFKETHLCSFCYSHSQNRFGIAIYTWIYSMSANEYTNILIKNSKILPSIALSSITQITNGVYSYINNE